MTNETRIERDTMGDVAVPIDALWGASTQRAVDNFPVSGLVFPRQFIRALGLIKSSAAQVSSTLGLLDPKIATAISNAADKVAHGDFDEHFPLDIFQTGSGTSTNTNANEVIANLASKTVNDKVHPNDHVNMGQSSNDVIPTALHLAALESTTVELLPAIRLLREALQKKETEFADVVKPGRTHLMDATPVTLGQEFGGYARQMQLGEARLSGTFGRLGELALGGTAVGTGINTHKEFAPQVIALLAKQTSLDLREATNHFEAQGAQDAALELSSALRTLAVSLAKIANDLRLMNSGPNAGFAEIRLPDLQPGSSIMPGKVNPVMAEVVVQVVAQVIGNDSAIAFACTTGAFELNVTLPVIAHNLLSSVGLLTSACTLLATKCVDGIEANKEHCRELVESTDILATALNPHIGYENAAKVVKQARATGRSVRDVAKELKVLDDAEIDRVLDVDAMARPHGRNPKK